MKPATGKTDPALASEKVSIRLNSGGHSFRDEELEGIDRREVVCEVLTPKTVAIPAEWFDPARVAAYLEASGAACNDEAAVWSRPAQGMVAVMALARAAAEALARRCDDRVRYTSPLLAVAPSEQEPCVLLRIEQGVYYINVWEAGLRLAEAFPLERTDDPLCRIARLDGEFGFGRFTCYFRGDGSLRKALKPYFKRVVCAS